MLSLSLSNVANVLHSCGHALRQCCPGGAFMGKIKGKLLCAVRGNPAKNIAYDFAKLGLDYVDLMLLHWPCDDLADSVRTYKALEGLVQDGRARAIGVSNFNASALAAFLPQVHVKPAVNQCGYSIAGHTLDAWGRDDATRMACEAHNITYSACERLPFPGQTLALMLETLPPPPATFILPPLGTRSSPASGTRLSPASGTRLSPLRARCVPLARADSPLGGWAKGGTGHVRVTRLDPRTRPLGVPPCTSLRVPPSVSLPPCTYCSVPPAVSLTTKCDSRRSSMIQPSKPWPGHTIRRLLQSRFAG